MVALMVLLNGSCLLNVLPCPLCRGQLCYCVFDVIKELVPQATHEHDDVEPLEGLPPSLSVGGIYRHHRHTQSHETPVLMHDSLCVLTNSLLLVLGEALEDVRGFLQWCPGNPPHFELVAEVGKRREHPAAGPVSLHDSLEP